MLEQKESESVIQVDTSKPYVMRLDGFKFSKFIEPFNKPYDSRGITLLSFSSFYLISLFFSSIFVFII